MKNYGNYIIKFLLSVNILLFAVNLYAGSNSALSNLFSLGKGSSIHSYSLKKSNSPNITITEISGQIHISLHGIKTDYKTFPVIGIYSINGRFIKELDSGNKADYFWDGTDSQNIPLSNGMYVVKLEFVHSVISQKILFIRE